MKLDATNLAIAAAVAVAIAWTLCAAYLAAAPGAASFTFRAMMHLDLAEPAMRITLGAYLIGLVAWVVSAAATGWLVGAIYNALSIGKIAS